MWWWGDFENYRKDGHIGPTACCACGGGVLADSRPESVRACSNPTQWFQTFFLFIRTWNHLVNELIFADDL